MTLQEFFIELYRWGSVVMLIGMAFKRYQSNNRLLRLIIAWLTGKFLCGSGAILNLLAMRANGGLMPVLQPSVAIPVGGSHRALTEGVNLYWLCDILGPISWRVSVGDIVILCGFLLGLVAIAKIYFMALDSLMAMK